MTPTIPPEDREQSSNTQQSIPEEIRSFIEAAWTNGERTGGAPDIYVCGAIDLYQHLTEVANKQPETMGQELRFLCNWSNKACDEFVVCMEDDNGKSYYSVLKGVFTRLVFNGDLIDERRTLKKHIAALAAQRDAYKEALEFAELEIKAMYKRVGISGSNVLTSVTRALNQYPSPKQQDK